MGWRKTSFCVRGESSKDKVWSFELSTYSISKRNYQLINKKSVKAINCKGTVECISPGKIKPTFKVLLKEKTISWLNTINSFFLSCFEFLFWCLWKRSFDIYVLFKFLPVLLAFAWTYAWKICLMEIDMELSHISWVSIQICHAFWTIHFHFVGTWEMIPMLWWSLNLR